MFRPMRRAKKAIPDEAAKRLLQTERRGVLAVNGDLGYPYAVPVMFLSDTTPPGSSTSTVRGPVIRPTLCGAMRASASPSAARSASSRRRRGRPICKAPSCSGAAA